MGLYRECGVYLILLHHTPHNNTFINSAFPCRLGEEHKHSMVFFSITHLSIAILIRINCVTSKGWVLQSNNITYEPLGICMFDRLNNFSYHYTCINQQLHFVSHTGTRCNESLLTDVPINDTHDCDEANLYN
eukprot:494671_1